MDRWRADLLDANGRDLLGNSRTAVTYRPSNAVICVGNRSDRGEWLRENKLSTPSDDASMLHDQYATTRLGREEDGRRGREGI